MEKLGYGLSRAPFATIVVSIKLLIFFKKNINLVSLYNVIFFCYIVNRIFHVHLLILQALSSLFRDPCDNDNQIGRS